ncbi:MAG: hypothetical protein NTX70_03685 [Verrucomicrobia bacterium]|nr:hypothetical protein [Verrucomicrobiota bacterium]
MSHGASLRLLSTDFDGTIHDDFGDPKIPHALQERIAAFQARGGHWVINTGRDMSSLMETLGRARVSIQPDYLILVEREIFERKHDRFLPVEPWNSRCTQDHARLFESAAAELEQQIQSLSARHEATFYADPFSPLCAIAQSNLQMDEIHAELDTFCERHPNMVAVRNDIYVRRPVHAAPRTRPPFDLALQCTGCGANAGPGRGRMDREQDRRQRNPGRPDPPRALNSVRFPPVPCRPCN